MMYEPCYVIPDSATRSGLKQQHTPLTPAILFLPVVIQVVFLLSLSLERGKIFHIFMFLERSAGRKFLLDLVGLNLSHAVLNVASLGTPQEKEIIKSKMLYLTVSSYHEMLSLKKVNPIGHQRVWRSKYQSLIQT